MTAIVGVEHKGGVVIGGDSAVTWLEGGGSSLIQTEAKVWQHGDWVFGSCGSCRVADLLQHSLTVPVPPDTDDEMPRFLRMEFADAVRACLLESGTVYSKNSIEEIANSNFLFGIHGKLYLMQEDFSVVHSASGYQATGCGFDLALGAMHATKTLKPTTRVQKALEAASFHNAACAPPFTIIDVSYS